MADNETTLLTAPTSTDTGTGEGSSADASGGEPTLAPSTTEPKIEEQGTQDTVYALTSPEGFEAGQTVLDDLTAYAKEHGLSNDQAQAQLGRELSMLKQSEEVFVEKYEKMAEDQKAQWLEDVKNDPEIGGEKFGISVSKAKRIIDKYGSDKLKQQLNESGYGNNPEVIRLFAKVSELDKEDSHENGGRPLTEEQSRAAVLYPND